MRIHKAETSPSSRRVAKQVVLGNGWVVGWLEVPEEAIQALTSQVEAELKLKGVEMARVRNIIHKFVGDANLDPKTERRVIIALLDHGWVPTPRPSRTKHLH